MKAKGFLKKMWMSALLLVTAQLLIRGMSQPSAVSSGAAQSSDNKPQLVVQLGHSVGVLSVAFSPDGRLALTGSWDWNSILWEVHSGRQIRKFIGHANLVTSVSFSPDGRFALTGSQDKTACLWDVATGLEMRRFEGHTDHLESVAFSSDGASILTGSKDGTARLWNPQTGQENLRLDHSGWGVSSAVFSPGDEFILTGCADGIARLWDIGTGRIVRLFRHAPSSNQESPLSASTKEKVNTVAYSHDGHLVLTGGDDSTAQLWQARTGERIDQYPYQAQGKVLAVAFSPDDRYILIGGEQIETSRSIHVWEISTRRELWRTEGRIKAAAFSPQGHLILTADGQQLINTVRLLDSATGTEVMKFEGSSGPVYSAAFSPNMNYLFTSGTSVTSSLWDLQDGKVLWGLRDSYDGPALGFSSPMSDRIANYSFAFSPDSRSLLVSEQTNTFVFNVENRKPISALQGERYQEQPSTSGRIIVTSLEPAWVKTVAFSPDGKLALTGSTGKVVRLWNVADAKEIRRLEGHTGAVEAASFSPDGQLIVTGSSDRTARLWEVPTGRELMVFAGHFDGVYSVAFSPDQNSILTGSGSLVENNVRQGGDYTARLWDIKTGKEIQRFIGHQSPLMSVGFSPNGQSVITGGFDGTARLWDRITGKEIRQFKGHSDIVKSVSFSPDGRFVLTASYDSTARLWDAFTDRELCRLISFRDGNWVVVDPDGRFDTTNLEEIKGLHWIMPDDAMKPLPLEIFMRDYYEPRLLLRILAGEQFRPVRSLADLNRVQPLVKITNIEQQKARPEVATVTVEVSNASRQLKSAGKTIIRQSGAFDVRLFRDGQIVGQYPLPDAQKPGRGDLLNWRKVSEIKFASSGKQTIRFNNIKLPRRAGNNEIEFSAYAFNEDRVKSETDKVFANFTNTKGSNKDTGNRQSGNDTVNRLSGSITFPLAVPMTQQKGKAYVITVGVNGYQNRAWNLRYAANDARDAQRLLDEKLKATKEYAEVIGVALVSDAEKREGGNEAAKKPTGERDATKANFKAALEELGKKVRPEDTVIIYYSSHGYADRRGNFYLFPTDIGEGTSKEINGQLLDRCISSEELSTWLRGVDAGEMVMIIDACQSAGTVKGEEGGEFKPGPMGSRSLGQLAYDKRMRILAASQADDFAFEYDKLQHGLLSYALLQDGIVEQKADAAPKDKTILMGEWLKYGEKRVPVLYEAMRKGKLENLLQTEGSKGARVTGAAASVKKGKFQQPSLFDFTKKKEDFVLVR